MEKAIVVGATGGTGASVAEELVKQGIQTVAFGRSRQKLEDFRARLDHPENLTIAVGDALVRMISSPLYG